MDKPHKKLDVWNLSMDLVIRVYRVTRSFPKIETYALSDQMRRAAVSVPSNIAEGAARQTKKEFANFLHIAQASLSELGTQLELARRLGYIDQGDGTRTLASHMERIDKMLTRLIARGVRRESVRAGERKA